MDMGFREEAHECIRAGLALAEQFTPEFEVAFHVPASIGIMLKTAVDLDDSAVIEAVRDVLLRWQDSCRAVRGWLDLRAKTLRPLLQDKVIDKAKYLRTPLPPWMHASQLSQTSSFPDSGSTSSVESPNSSTSMPSSDNLFITGVPAVLDEVSFQLAADQLAADQLAVGGCDPELWGGVDLDWGLEHPDLGLPTIIDPFLSPGGDQ